MATSGASAAADEAGRANAAIARLLQGPYEQLFRASAEAFVKASERGARDVEIADSCRHLFTTEGFSSPEADELYTSPASVGKHRRTGLILRKSEPLPPGVKARDVQSLVGRLPTGKVDEVIQMCATQAEAYRALEKLAGLDEGRKTRRLK